jgi:hypothetical protein
MLSELLLFDFVYRPLKSCPDTVDKDLHLCQQRGQQGCQLLSESIMMKVVDADDEKWPERYVERAKLAQVRQRSKLEGASSPSAKLTSPSTPASRAGLDLASAASFLFVPLFCAAASLLGMPDENCLRRSSTARS